jgi:hypothetical protein
MNLTTPAPSTLLETVPRFPDELPFVDEAFDDALPVEPELEPEWLQDFDPWVLEAIQRYEAMEVNR